MYPDLLREGLVHTVHVCAKIENDIIDGLGLTYDVYIPNKVPCAPILP